VNFNGGVLETAAGFTSDRNMALNSATNVVIIAGATTLDGTLGGSGALAVSGAGTLTLGGVNTYGGGTSVTGVAVSVSADDNLGAPSTAIALTNATLDATAGFSTNRNATLTGSDSIDPSAGVTFSDSGIISGSGSLTVAGPGALALTGPNTYGGGTTLASGTLAIVSDGNLGNTAGAVTMNGGTLQLDGAVTSARAFKLAAGGGTIDTTADGGTFSGPFTGAGGLTEIGVHTLTLSGSSSATGGITVAGGQLAVNASFKSDPVSVDAGATLSGHGAVGAITAGSGGAGSISPGLGAATPQILTAPSVDGSNGLAFNFQLNQLGSPTYGNASASGNDLLHLTAANPFTFGSLDSGNIVSIYLATGADSSVFRGGFFADNLSAAALYADIENATFEYYIENALGSVSYNGNDYSAVVPSSDITLTTGTEAAVFTSGTVDGAIAIFTVASNAPQPLLLESPRPELTFGTASVPEPGTYGLIILGGILIGYCARRGKALSGRPESPDSPT
jgi:autotransporter-associated beta strand protein